MEKILRVLLSTIVSIVILWPYPAFSKSFKHTSVIYTEESTGMVGDGTSTVYATFPDGNDISEYVRAEYIDRKTFTGRERSLNLTKDGFMHRVNLDTDQCTKTDIRKMTEGFYKGGDPEESSRNAENTWF